LSSCISSSERLLANKITSLDRTSGKYHSLILEYCTSLLQPGAIVAVEDKYRLVLDKIKKLWVKSEKETGLFDTVEKFEDVLKDMRDRDYRDDFIHSFNVFLLGYYILNRLDMTQSESQSNDVDLSWMLAATFHDVAYTIQDMEVWINQLIWEFLGINPKLSINVAQILPITYPDFMKIISSWHKGQFQTASEYYLVNSIDWTFLNEMNTSLTEGKDHGVLGALILAHLLAIRHGFLPREGFHGNFLYNHVPACHAISAHHMSAVKVSFEKHPLAFLLILCDELQDESRPRAPGKREESDTVKLLDIEVTRANLSTVNKRPRITVKIEASEEKQKNLVDTLRKRLVEADPETLVIKNADDRIIFPCL
jgi:hypothetical protein